MTGRSTIARTPHSNGPGRFEVGPDAPYSHPYDGDGLVCAISFSNGRAFFRSRFVQTPELQAELQAGRVLFRNAFATQRKGAVWANALDTYVKNTANTNVVCWGGRCLALFEVWSTWCWEYTASYVRTQAMHTPTYTRTHTHAKAQQRTSL